MHGTYVLVQRTWHGVRHKWPVSHCVEVLHQIMQQIAMRTGGEGVSEVISLREQAGLQHTSTLSSVKEQKQSNRSLHLPQRIMYLRDDTILTEKCLPLSKGEVNTYPTRAYVLPLESGSFTALTMALATSTTWNERWG